MGLATTPGGDDAAADDMGARKAVQQIERGVDMVQSTTLSEAALPKPPQGQSQPRAGESMAGETVSQPPDPGPSVRPASWTAYVDPTYGFRIGYPHGFVVQPQDVAK
jgi:hypothetical protein